MLTCLSKQYFGVECPGCGAQRSLVCLCRGELLDSIALFPALIPLMIFMIISGLSLIKPLNLNLKWVVIIAIVTFSIMLVHYIMKIAGLAPWYFEAAHHFH
jgi:ABC-type transport system involved in cytochrome c biogenesis permease component